MSQSKSVVIVSSLVLLSSISSWAAHYEVDASHSSISFLVRHMMVSKVKGGFNKYTGSFEYDPAKKADAKVNVVIDAASIDTRESKRDEHLKSADFFEVKKYPHAMFVSQKVLSSDDKAMKIQGDLTIRDITKPVVLDVEIGGMGKDSHGNPIIAFSGKTKISRKDFGLKWNKLIETGGVAVGDEVEIEIEIEGHQKKLEK